MRNKFNKNIIFAVLIITAIVTVQLFTVNRGNGQSVIVFTNDNCGTISLTTQPENTTLISGIVDVVVNNIPTTKQVKGITIYGQDSVNKKPLGLAQPNGTNTWKFRWMTALWTAGTVKLSANISFTNYSDTSCSLELPHHFAVSNNQPTTITNIAQPESWTGYVNSIQLFSIKSKVNQNLTNSTFDSTPYTIYAWSQKIASIGQLFSSNGNFLNNTETEFSSGNTPGENIISVIAIYGGTETTIKIPIVVNSANSTQTAITPNTTTSTNNITNTTDTTDKSTIIKPSDLPTTTQVTSSQLQVSPVTKTCVEKVLSPERYTLIINNKTRPTVDKLTKISNCFAPSKYILPSNFSPIDPIKIDDLKIDDTTTVGNLKNVTIKNDGIEKQTLKITGTAKPNSTVIIYIFSDPLVITTSADNEGNWQYTLEDPLEPGKHEVYTVVDKGDGTYKRSDPLSFVISTAAATDANPNGLSLNLAKAPTRTPNESNTNMILFVAGSIAVLVITLVGLYFVVIRTHKKHQHQLRTINQLNNSVSNSTTNDSMNQLNNNDSQSNIHDNSNPEQKEE